MSRGTRTEAIDLFDNALNVRQTEKFSGQLLKWVGNKQRFAPEIISCFPESFDTYFEPFLGSGAVLGTLAPHRAVASDALKPLIEIWQTLVESPHTVKKWYRDRWNLIPELGKKAAFERVKRDFNNEPNPADLLFISRSCYGGVVRFRKADGYISTPCGIHNPISPESFAKRADGWFERVKHTEFVHADFASIMDRAKRGDLVYCDPPYSHTQSILYGAQEFNVARLFDSITACKARGVAVVLSIDGSKQSGKYLCDIAIPDNVFEQEISIDVGRSMLRRFQLQGQTLEGEGVRDRLLLTY